MNNLLVISVCERHINKNHYVGYQFMFIGEIDGEIVNKIKVKTIKEHFIGSEYLLLLQVDKLEGGFLKTLLIDSKELKK